MAKNGGLEDLSLVKKYVMSDAEYDKRKNTLRAFKKEKLKEDPKFRLFPKKNGKVPMEAGKKEDRAMGETRGR